MTVIQLTRPNQFTAMHFKEFTDKIKDSSQTGGTGLPHSQASVPRFTGKTRITGKTTEIPERQKNNREILICPSPIKKTVIDY